MITHRKCSACGLTKPVSEYSPNPQGRDGYQSKCKACRADVQRAANAGKSKEELAAQMAAYRAGIRKDRCAVCSGQIKGQGICSRCDSYISALGGLDGLKRATRAVKWLRSQ